jgi:hypothetical protein
MQVSLSSQVPREYQTKKGTTYETRYIYTGFRKYDVERKKIIEMTQGPNDTFFISESPYSGNVLSRGYHVELVRVTVYSESPRVWKEELSPHEVYFFAQQQPTTT